MEPKGTPQTGFILYSVEEFRSYIALQLVAHNYHLLKHS